MHILYVQNVIAIRLIMRKDKPEVLIRQQLFFIHVLIVNINGIKIDLSYKNLKILKNKIRKHISNPKIL